VIPLDDALLAPLGPVGQLCARIYEAVTVQGLPPSLVDSPCVGIVRYGVSAKELAIAVQSTSTSMGLTDSATHESGVDEGAWGAGGGESGPLVAVAPG
jgi:hypothetical protein